MQFTKNFSDKISALKNAIDNAEAVVIGAGSGLSTAAGFTYSGERFDRYFSDFILKYGFTDMYSGGFYPFDSLEERWAYWSRYIFINRYMDAPNDTYKRLFTLVEDKEYFVLTTNVDHQFQKAGFDKKRLFYTQGDYGLFQCSKPCHNMTYDNEQIIREMYDSQENMRIPAELIPICPKCGEPMIMNLRCDNSFVEDEGWHKAAERYKCFLEENSDKKILLMELGVGMNTPGIIKYPFWQMTYKNKNAMYVCINYSQAYAPKEIAVRTICINDDIFTILECITE